MRYLVAQCKDATCTYLQWAPAPPPGIEAIKNWNEEMIDSAETHCNLGPDHVVEFHTIQSSTEPST